MSKYIVYIAQHVHPSPFANAVFGFVTLSIRKIEFCFVDYVRFVDYVGRTDGISIKIEKIMSPKCTEQIKVNESHTSHL